MLGHENDELNEVIKMLEEEYAKLDVPDQKWLKRKLGWFYDFVSVNVLDVFMNGAVPTLITKVNPI